MSRYQRILTEGKIGNMTLKNRMIMPAMGTGMHNPDGTVSDQLIEYHRVRSAGGVGMDTVEIVAVHPTTKGQSLGIYDDSFVPGLEKLADTIKSNGAKAAVQIWHGGRQISSQSTGQPIVAPSAIPCPLIQEEPEVLKEDMIQEIIQSYGDAALRAKLAGFNAVEIHGAHGYLIAEFLSAYSNKREDKYGGTIENRARFAIEVIKDVRKKVGDNYPILFRISGEEEVEGGLIIDETKRIAPMLVDAGADAIHVSIGNYATLHYVVPPMDLDRGFNLWTAEEIKNVVNVPVVGVDRINTPEMAELALERNQCDFVALGRGLLADPEFPNKVLNNKREDIRQCIACNQECVDRLLLEQKFCSCLVNPACGREKELSYKPMKNPLKVVVIGGGPAGMEAARIARDRGCEVVLYEKSKQLGGQWRIAGMLPSKYEINENVEWMIRQIMKNGTQIKLNTLATPDAIKEDQPDVVFLASGAVPTKPDISGIDNSCVHYAHDVIENPDQIKGKNVIVIGAGPTGLEVAKFFAIRNMNVKVIEATDQAALGMGPARKLFLMQKLKEAEVEIIYNSLCASIEDDKIIIQKKASESEQFPVDDVIIAMGVQSDNSLEEKLEGVVPKIIAIGDAKQPGKANDAIYQGQKAAISL